MSLYLKHISKIPYQLRSFCTLSRKSALNLSQCYKIFGLSPSCSDADLKLAYLSLVKQFHPDSSNQNSKEEFHNVQEAYEALLAARKNDFTNYEGGAIDQQEVDFDIKHTAPQHRQYLEYGGAGSGTPGQRQRQYQQLRAEQAFESVSDHRVDKAKLQAQIDGQNNNQLVQQANLKSAKKIQTRSFMDRLVEDLIQESISKGEFDNLDGEGKPLPDRGSDVNPFVDLATHNLNRILIQNGYAPEWAIKEREIRECLEFATKQLTLTRRKLGPYPFESETEEKLWQQELALFTERIREINRMINNYNLVTPTLRQQMVHFSFDKFSDEILTDSSLPYSSEPEETDNASNFSSYSMEPISLSGFSISDIGKAFLSFWQEIKSMHNGNKKN